jgi:CspA family cold shock protein
MNGTIVRKRDEGYGFIKPEDGSKDVFFHASSLVDIAFDDLSEGDAVTFDVEQGPKGPAATNIAKA